MHSGQRLSGDAKIMEMQDSDSKLIQERKRDRQKLFASTSKLSKKTSMLKLKIQQAIKKKKNGNPHSDGKKPGNSGNRSIHEIEILLKEIEENLRKCKFFNNEQYEKLKGKMIVYSKNIQIFSENLDALEKPLEPYSYKKEKTDDGEENQRKRKRRKFSKVKSKVSIHNNTDEGNNDSSIPMEVKVYDEFLKNNGEESGGWDKEEHKFFMKLYKKYKGNENLLLNEIVRRIQTQDISAAAEHLEFVKKLERLRKAKKIAIKEWVEKKRKKNDEEIKKLNTDEKRKKEKNMKEKQRKKTLERNLKKRKKVLEWKIKKQREKVKKEKEEELKRLKETKQKEKKKRERQEKNKEKLEDYQIKKELQEKEKERKKIQKIEKANDRMKNVDLTKFQRRDEEIMLRRNYEKKKKQIEKQKMDDRLNKYLSTFVAKPDVKRDFSRLTSKTELQKKRDTIKKKEKLVKKDSDYVLYAQRRIVPSWRSNL